MMIISSRDEQKKTRSPDERKDRWIAETRGLELKTYFEYHQQRIQARPGNPATRPLLMYIARRRNPRIAGPSYQLRRRRIAIPVICELKDGQERLSRSISELARQWWLNPNPATYTDTLMSAMPLSMKAEERDLHCHPTPTDPSSAPHRSPNSYPAPPRERERPRASTSSQTALAA